MFKGIFATGVVHVHKKKVQYGRILIPSPKENEISTKSEAVCLIVCSLWDNSSW